LVYYSSTNRPAGQTDAIDADLPGRRSPQIAFRVPAELQAGAEKLAAQRGTTVSQLAREALETYLAVAR